MMNNKAKANDTACDSGLPVEVKPKKLRHMQKYKDDLEKDPPSAPAPEVIERYIKNTGRPPRYKTPEEMQEIIIDYFLSNMAEVRDTETGEHRGYKWCNRISLGDLAIHLGMHLQQLWEYGQRDAFTETVKNAKNIVENYYEKALQENRNPAGLCFILKNGFGWRDVQNIAVEPVQPLGEELTREDIVQKVAELPAPDDYSPDD